MASLRHYALRVQDVARSRKFYADGLGLRFLGYRSDGEAVDLSDGHANLTIIPYVGEARAPLEEGTEFIHLGFLVDDLTAVYERLVAQGADVVREDVKERRLRSDDSPPVGSFKVLDPDGNVLDISERADEWRV